MTTGGHTMLDNISRQAIQIIEDAKKIAIAWESPLVGTEHLLLAMYEMRDTICRFLLEDRLIEEAELRAVLEEMIVLRKKEHKEILYTKKFQEVIYNAKELAILLKSEYVFDEHLFYSLLKEESTVAKDVLERLGVNIPEMLKDIEDIFGFKNEPAEPFPFLTNLSTVSRPHDFVQRGNHIERIKIIMNKKQKNNPMLIGNAGVGKTAIIESLARDLPNETIYRLDLGGILAGTKYRGELEEKIVKAMEFIKENKAILFIDEIHNIVGAGSNEGSLDIANILKPYLARPDIRCIGSTTLEEYYRHIEKDKALLRRFQNIYVDEPTVEETKTILKGIKHFYEDYHEVVFSDADIDQIVMGCEMYLPNRAFPDKAIDVLDEAGARLKNGDEFRKGVVIDQVIKDMSGLGSVTLEELKNMPLHYEELRPFYVRFLSGFSTKSNIAKILAGRNFSLEKLKEDLYAVFGFKEEMLLQINLDHYHDTAAINNLIGSSKGYVGYESGGILTEHLLKYPLSLIFLDCFGQAHPSVKSYLKKLFSLPFVIDNKGRKVSLRNSVFVIKDFEQKRSPIGLIREEIIANSKAKKANGFNPEMLDFGEFDAMLSESGAISLSSEKRLERFMLLLNRLRIELVLGDNPKTDDDLEKVVSEILLQGQGRYRLFYRNGKYQFEKTA